MALRRCFFHVALLAQQDCDFNVSSVCGFIVRKVPLKGCSLSFIVERFILFLQYVFAMCFEGPIKRDRVLY